MTWQALRTALAERFPIRNYRLVIRIVPTANHGNTSLSESRRTITITVRASDDFSTQVHTLLHEWAHAVWMDTAKGEPDSWRVDRMHDPRWATLYSRIYRFWETL